MVKRGANAYDRRKVVRKEKKRLLAQQLLDEDIAKASGITTADPGIAEISTQHNNLPPTADSP